MSDGFVRVQEAADRSKGWDATRVEVQGVTVYRQRTEASPESLRLEDTGVGVIYVGKASAGALESSPVWRIKKILTSGGNILILFPEGDTGYGFVWADRAGYSYS